MEVDSLTRIPSASAYNKPAAREAEAAPKPQPESPKPEAVKHEAAQVQRAQDAAQKTAEGERESREIKPDNSAAHSLMLKAVEQANKKLVGVSRQLQISVHEKTDRLIIKVINSDTDEVIREIPPENTLDQFAKVLELNGLMVDEER